MENVCAACLTTDKILSAESLPCTTVLPFLWQSEQKLMKNSGHDTTTKTCKGTVCWEQKRTHGSYSQVVLQRSRLESRVASGRFRSHLGFFRIPQSPPSFHRHGTTWRPSSESLVSCEKWQLSKFQQGQKQHNDFSEKQRSKLQKQHICSQACLQCTQISHKTDTYFESVEIWQSPGQDPVFSHLQVSATENKPLNYIKCNGWLFSQWGSWHTGCVSFHRRNCLRWWKLMQESTSAQSLHHDATPCVAMQSPALVTRRARCKQTLRIDVMLSCWFS